MVGWNAMTDPSGQLLNLTIVDWHPKEIAFSDLQRFFFLMSTKQGHALLFIESSWNPGCTEVGDKTSKETSCTLI